MAIIPKTVSALRLCVRQPASTLHVRAFSMTTAAANKNDITHPFGDNVVPVDAVSGAPDAVLDRTVRIYRPAKSATQSGKQGTRHWRIDFDILEEGNRWENPLIGWASSADYQQALALKFPTQEEAIRFAERQGWNYYVQEQKPVKFVKKSYAENYKYSPGPLRLIKTK